jgi:hypothetical protein
MPPTAPIKKKATKFQYIAGATIGIIIGIIILSALFYVPPTPILTTTTTTKRTPTSTITTTTPTPDTSALDAILKLSPGGLLWSKWDEVIDAGLRDDHSTAYQITYEMEELLGKALKEYSAIAERLTPEMSHGYKIQLTLWDVAIKSQRELIEFSVLIDLSSQAYEDPILLPQLELALASYKNLIPEFRQLADTLQKIYEQDPKTSEEWGLIPSFIADIRERVTYMESNLDMLLGDYEDIKAYWKEYTPIEQKNIKASSETRDRLMALGIIPSDLASFFDRFDADGNGKISLDEGEAFFYWVEKNIKYRYDDENSERGIQEVRAGLKTPKQLGDGRPGSEYWQKPYETFIEGYGDCEDMAILETAFYNYFGVEAYVALVSVKKPGIIDHALAIVKIGDNLDEYKKYLGGLNYYKLNGKYFMMVDNAFSNKYGYISGGTIGVNVDFTLIKYYALEQIGALERAKWWA